MSDRLVRWCIAVFSVVVTFALWIHWLPLTIVATVFVGMVFFMYALTWLAELVSTVD